MGILDKIFLCLTSRDRARLTEVNRDWRNYHLRPRLYRNLETSMFRVSDYNPKKKKMTGLEKHIYIMKNDPRFKDVRALTLGGGFRMSKKCFPELGKLYPRLLALD